MREDGGRGRGRGRKKTDGGGGRGKRRGLKKADGLSVEEQEIVAWDGGDHGPSIAFFDYCFEGHLKTLDLISSLYSGEDVAGGMGDEVKRFSSVVTFVRGWRQQFCYYKPQAIRFSHDVGAPGRPNLEYGFELSQFSAASIRKVENEPSRITPTKACDGFVLQVGGPVWALDWCHGTQIASGSSFSCEYLAVSAHPSDSPLHKIGAALSGPGLVQIWFLLSVTSERGSSSSSHNEARMKRRRNGRTSACEDVNDNVSISGTVGKADGVADLNGIQGNIGGLATITVPEESLSSEQLGLIRSKKKRKLKDQARTGSPSANTLSASVHLGDSKSILQGDGSLSTDVLKELALPKIVLCLAHDGRVAWDVKWQPCSNQENHYRMGFLAVLLGDGSIQVWEVPSPRIIKALFVSSHIKDTDPRFMKLKPVFKCSKLLRGDSQSIPLTLEWSRTVPNDLLLVGCHDGTVALWKFLPEESYEDRRPLLCFAADTFPIRAISWAPNERDANCKNLVATAGHSGNIRFWDIRDPFRPLWDLHLSRGYILDMDWVHDPRPFSGKPCQGLQTYYCSSHAVWSVQVSQVTGMVAYCSADGSVLHFQLTSRGVEKDKRRHRTPHYLCGSLREDTGALTLSIPKMGTASPMKRVLDELGKTPRPLRVSLSDLTHAITASPLSSARNLVEDEVLDSVDELPLVAQNAKARVSRSTKNKRKGTGKTDTIDDDDGQNLQMVATGSKESPMTVAVFPPKVVSMNRVRWNPNRGCEKWLCYGGAAGLIRCQQISMPILER